MINEIMSILVRGTLIGGCYSILAIGLTLLFGVARIINLAHGSLFMLGAFMYIFFTGLLNPWYALAAAVIFTGVIGVILYKTTIHPILGDDVAVLVVTITTAILIQNLVVIRFGMSINRMINPIGESYFTFLGVPIAYTSTVFFYLSLVLFVTVALLVNKTKIGRAMKAISQDREAAMLMGVNINKILPLVTFLSTSLAALAGFMYSISALGYGGYAIYYMWLSPLTTSFAIVILGGLGSIKGSFLGSFIIAYTQQIVGNLVPQGGGIISIAPPIVILAILLIRPKGLFGRRVEMEE
jgi:branched-chain amino acid transport system permease protein